VWEVIVKQLMRLTERLSRNTFDMSL